MRRVARAEQGVRTAAEPTETVASTSRTVEWHRVSAIATGGRVVGPRRYRSASAIARSLRQASATASPRARAVSSCTSARWAAAGPHGRGRDVEKVKKGAAFCKQGFHESLIEIAPRRVGRFSCWRALVWPYSTWRRV